MFLMRDFYYMRKIPKAVTFGIYFYTLYFLKNFLFPILNFRIRNSPISGIVKKCAVEENPKSEIDRYQAA